ncbi:MAG: putative sporulation protein YtxC [Peptococcales bacterium]
MVDAILVGTSKNPKALINRFENGFKTFKLNYNINNKGNITFLGCDYDQNISPREFKNILANIIADIIVEDWAQILIKRIIRDHYYYFNEEEKKNIREKALELLNTEGFSYKPLIRKNSIVQRVIEYLERHQEIVLEGFVNFRLKDYLLEIEDIVDAAVDDFLLEKEYLEFIRLLRYFVEIQEPKVNEVHILFEKDNAFKLVDRHGKLIENEYMDGFSIELMNSSINYEDLLISALITLAPRLVVMHLTDANEPKDTIKTIDNVFGKKAKQCTGCNLCTKKKET